MCEKESKARAFLFQRRVSERIKFNSAEEGGKPGPSSERKEQTSISIKSVAGVRHVLCK